LFQAFNKGDGRIIRIPCCIKRNRPGPSNPEGPIHRLLDIPSLRGTLLTAINGWALMPRAGLLDAAQPARALETVVSGVAG